LRASKQTPAYYCSMGSIVFSNSSLVNYRTRSSSFNK
jgi:hypothetical protein